MTAHSRIGASSMERWTPCPGSVVLGKDAVRTSSVHAELGTAAHAVAEHVLANRQLGTQLSSWVGKPFEYDDHGESKVITVDENMAVHLQVYLDYVLNQFVSASGPVAASLHVEHKFDLSVIHDGLFGTADCVLWNPNTRELEVIDLKYGASKPVKVQGNSQLRYYALGALVSLYPVANSIRITIVQPRCKHKDGPIRSETLKPMDLVEWSGDLKDAAKRVSDAESEEGSDGWDEKYLADGGHCFFCPAIAGCPVMLKKRIATALLDFE